MIAGTVNADDEAVIRLRVQGSTGPAHEVDAMIDTGFHGFLTLPPAVVTALGLPYRSRGRALLAHSSEELFDIYGVTVLWDGQQRYVEADAVDTAPLVRHAAAGGLRSPRPGRSWRAGGHRGCRPRPSVLNTTRASTGLRQRCSASKRVRSHHPVERAPRSTVFVGCTCFPYLWAAAHREREAPRHEDHRTSGSSSA